MVGRPDQLSTLQNNVSVHILLENSEPGSVTDAAAVSDTVCMTNGLIVSAHWCYVHPSVRKEKLDHDAPPECVSSLPASSPRAWS
eukprot:3428478-Pyramimonas_sp.AAC.1